MAENDSSASPPDADAEGDLQNQTDRDKFDIFKILGKPKGAPIANRTDNIIFMTEKGICMRLADDPIKSARLTTQGPKAYIQLTGLLKLAGYEYDTPFGEIPDDLNEKVCLQYIIPKFGRMMYRVHINQLGHDIRQPRFNCLAVDDAEQLSKDLGIYNTCRQFFNAIRNRPQIRPIQCGICGLHWHRNRASFCFWSKVHCKHGRDIPWKDLVYRVCSCGSAFVTIDDFKAHLAERECFDFDG